MSPNNLDERFQSSATSYAIFFSKFILHIFFSFLLLYGDFGVGILGLGFSVQGVWGPGCEPF